MFGTKGRIRELLGEASYGVQGVLDILTSQRCEEMFTHEGEKHDFRKNDLSGIIDTLTRAKKNINSVLTIEEEIKRILDKELGTK